MLFPIFNCVHLKKKDKCTHDDLFAQVYEGEGEYRGDTEQSVIIVTLSRKGVRLAVPRRARTAENALLSNRKSIAEEIYTREACYVAI